ncbi:MAG: type II secretion system protein [Vampirovibrionales bacterium]
MITLSSFRINYQQGFTLSELLVSLAVLGLIAIFAVPKVLNAVGNSAMMSVTKESMAAMMDAYHGLGATQTTGAFAASTRAALMVKRLNFVRSCPNLTATGEVGSTGECDFNTATGSCHILMHNGTVISLLLDDNFNDIAGNTGSVGFYIDPDGSSDAHPGRFAISYDGRLMAGPRTVVNTPPYRYGDASDSLNGLSISTPLFSGGPAPVGTETTQHGASSNHPDAWYY